MHNLWFSVAIITMMAIFKAMADTLKDHFYVSVFKKKDPNFWDPNISWQKVGVIPGTSYHLDAWHGLNSLFISSSIVLAIFHHQQFKWYEEVLGYGILFIVVFNLFYNKLLKSK